MTAQNTLPEVTGKKATLVIMNSVGLVTLRHVTLSKIELREQYQNSFRKNLCAWFTLKGKRKATGLAFEQVAIFEGWQPFFSVPQNDIIVAEFSQSKYEIAKSRFKNLIIEHIA